MKSILLTVLFSFFLIPVTSHARTWHVRQDDTGDCTTIQACVDSAGNGDTILVAPGTYMEHVALFKVLVLISEGGPSVTRLVRSSITDPILLMGTGAVADGFTIRDGLCMGPCDAGGVYIGWGATLRNCLIVKNDARGIDSPGDGGGVLAAGNAVIEGNTIVSNGPGAMGGGIYCMSGFTGQIVRNIVALNVSQGSAIYCEPGANPTFLCNNVWGNVGGDYGGACGNPTGLNGNISLDPLFCDSAQGDYRLGSDSPCANVPDCGQIGVFGIACGPTPVTQTTWGRIKALFR